MASHEKPAYELLPHTEDGEASLQPMPYASEPSSNSSVGKRFCLNTWLGRLGWLVALILSVLLVWRFRTEIVEVSSDGLEQLDTLRAQLQEAVMGQKKVDWSNIDTLFIFGDSYSSTGHWDSLPSRPQDDNPIVDDQGHFSDVPNWVNYLTAVHNHTAYRAFNFAVGGSTVDHELVHPYLMGTSFRKQTQDLFRPKFDVEEPLAPWDPASTVFIIWFGTNDIHITFREDPTRRPPLAEIFETYQGNVEQLYHAGARNFLFLTVAPFDRATPVVFPTGPRAAAFVEYSQELNYKLEEIADIEAYNARLFKLRARLRQGFPDVSAYVFDAHAFYARVLETPEQFEAMNGVKYTRRICEPVWNDNDTYYTATCKDDGELLGAYAWTNLHPTYPVQDAMAARLVQDCFSGDGKRGFCL